MNRNPLKSRRTALLTCRIGALGSATMFAVTSVSMLVAASNGGVQAGPPTGPARIEVPSSPTQPAGVPLNSGGSATSFALLVPPAASCSGDGSAGYRSHSYIVPASVDPSTMTFNSSGPVPNGVGANLRQPMYSTAGGSAWTNKTPSAEAALIVDLVPFSFAVYAEAGGATAVPEGTYNVGIACTSNSGATFDRYWNVQIDITHDAADTPAGFTWEVAEAVEPTTTTSTTTTMPAQGTSTTTTTTTPPAGGTTTTTVAGGSTTTTVAGGSTTTVAGGSTTTTRPGGASSTTTTVASGAVVTTTTQPTGGITTTTFRVGSGGVTTTTLPRQLPNGGSSSWTLVAWAVGLLVFGRMAILLGRTPKVLPLDRQ